MVRNVKYVPDRSLCSVGVPVLECVLRKLKFVKLVHVLEMLVKHVYWILNTDCPYKYVLDKKRFFYSN